MPLPVVFALSGLWEHLDIVNFLILRRSRTVMRRLLLYIGLFCCLSLHGQTLEVLPAAEASGVSLVLPSWKNFTALLLMDEEQQTAVLQGYGYTALQPMWGYRRYSNTQDELPSYMLGQHLLMCDTGEVRCVVSLNLHALADAVRALKEELRSNYIGEMPDEDGYRIDIYALRWQGKDYEVYITNRPMYFDVVVKELRLRRIIFFRNRLESLPIYPSATS